ncbi:hypothetical protein ADEAN_000556900 [Angomonas deanei]|uniref:Uncharacterized protein n=1 Tax=Angomonas deanei TaxID=59799 RepID=A0A7G2CHB6_9TRYP|nr:hypothetical protein ADEAN_000556900 [Angomonas deanei]
MIERIEIRGAKHYPLIISHDDGRISNFGLVVRVLEHGAEEEEEEEEKDATAASPCERHVTDWLTCLFRRSLTFITESVSILENLNLLLTAVQVGTPNRDASSHKENLLSIDFGKSVSAALVKRYGFLFFHGNRSSAHSEYGGHPLFQLLVEQRDVDPVLAQLATNIQGTPDFPCDFTSFGMSSDETHGGLPQSQMQELKRWIVESLYFFGLTHPDLPGQMAKLLSQTQELPRNRILMQLLMVHKTLNLPIDVLDNTAKCCF